MNSKGYFFSFFLAVALIACNKDNTPDEITSIEAGNTYVSASISFAQPKAMALPDSYSSDGTYNGIGLVNTIDLYLVSADGTADAKRFEPTDFTINTTGATLTLNQPFKTTSGNKTIYMVINSPNALATTAPNDNDLWDIEGLATSGSDETASSDLITMTGKTMATILPNITEQAASSGQNMLSINVTRLASKVIVTTTASPDVISNGVRIGAISNVTYSVAQGTKKVYFMAKPDYTTYGSEYVPTAEDDYNTNAPIYYDYSDLFTPSPVPVKPSNYKALAGKLLFENTHAEGSYRTGNTAYVLIKAVFTPDPSAIADGGTLEDGTFYVGADGNIYSSMDAALSAVADQDVSLYSYGEVIYYVWINPDNVEMPENSPVLRNNIYHINITGFHSIGWNWNPLYPEDMNVGVAGGNPDDIPDNYREPSPPIEPAAPLEPDESRMTATVNLLKWAEHSNNVDVY